MSYKKILSPANGSQLVPDTKLQEWKVVDSDKAPTNTNLIWNKDGILKKYEDGEWVDALEGVLYVLPPNTKLNGLVPTEYIDKIDWSKCKNYNNASNMFANCKMKSLDLSQFNMEKISNTTDMFNSCTKLKTLKLPSSFKVMINISFAYCYELSTPLDLSDANINSTSLIKMFYECLNLPSVELFKYDSSKYYYNDVDPDTGEIVITPRACSVQDMFYRCNKITTLNLDGWDFTNIASAHNMFGRCYSLTTIKGPIKGLGNKYTLLVYLCLSNCPLTRESALVFINGLVEKTDGKTYSLSFSTTTKALLTDEDIAIATEKGWTIA